MFINIQSIQCIYRYTVSPSKHICDIVEGLLMKQPCQEDRSEDEDSDPDDETNAGENNPMAARLYSSCSNTLSSRA